MKVRTNKTIPPGWVLIGMLAMMTVAVIARPELSGPIQFNRDVLPILADKCFSCHGPDPNQRKSGLRLDLRDGATAEKKGLRAISPGDLARSAVWRRITTDNPDEVMPPPKVPKKLNPAEKAVIRRWIEEGAPYQNHWAFELPRRSALPAVRNRAWPKNAVDHFILARLEQEGLSPGREVSGESLIRRITLDLTGLPPAPERVRIFLGDRRPDRVERVVAELMATRAYAERQAQDWLDLARYADSNGYADDQTRDIWPYREWVINAIARNLPFDQFTIEQLAGDMLPGATTEQRIASAFHRNAPQAKGNTYPVEEYRLKGVSDRVNTTGTVWLGLTLACAECHDHKFDPITQRDYFSMFALFNNVVHTGEAFAQDGPNLQLASAAHHTRQRELDQQVAAATKRVEVRESELDAGAAKVDSELKRLKEILAASVKERTELEQSIPRLPVMEELATPRDTRIHLRGNFLNKGDAVSPAVPALFTLPPEQQPRNRLEFARWLVDGRNPLVARVAVNRLWQACYGHGLVRTPADFGRQGALPSHPELLDWLACELVESGWDVRHVHQLLVNSATYRQSARVSAAVEQRDLQNMLLTRAPRPRLPGEQIRDQALAVAGLLVTGPSGKPVFPVQTSGYWEERALPGKWVDSSGADRHRRSLYTYWRRMALHPSLELLDAPARSVCTAKRSVSNVPTQALVTLNDPIFVEAAEAFAARLLREVPSGDSARVAHAFHLALCRAPAQTESARFLAFLRQQRARTPDEKIVWTAVTAVLLNLDEFLCRP